MNKKQKDEQYKLFAEAFHEVVVPELQDTNIRLDRIENKLDKIEDRLDRHGKTLDNHEKRIDDLETQVNISPA